MKVLSLVVLLCVAFAVADKPPATSSYGVPPPPVAYGVPQQTHQPPAPTYGAPVSTYGGPAPTYGAPPAPTYGAPPASGGYSGPPQGYRQVIHAYLVPVQHHGGGGGGGGKGKAKGAGLSYGGDKGKGGKGSGLSYGEGPIKGHKYTKKGGRYYFADHIRDKWIKLRDYKDYIYKGFDDIKSKFYEWKGTVLREKGHYLKDKGEKYLEYAYTHGGKGKGKFKGHGIKGGYWDDEYPWDDEEYVQTDSSYGPAAPIYGAPVETESSYAAAAPSQTYSDPPERHGFPAADTKGKLDPAKHHQQQHSGGLFLGPIHDTVYTESGVSAAAYNDHTTVAEQYGAPKPIDIVHGGGYDSSSFTPTDHIFRGLTILSKGNTRHLPVNQHIDYGAQQSSVHSPHQFGANQDFSTASSYSGINSQDFPTNDAHGTFIKHTGSIHVPVPIRMIPAHIILPALDHSTGSSYTSYNAIPDATLTKEH